MTGDGYVGYQDFAGSGPVHIVGGGAALAGAIILGPRTGRFVRINGVEQSNPFGGHSTPLVAIGALVLFFDFLGFLTAGRSCTFHGRATGQSLRWHS